MGSLAPRSEGKIENSAIWTGIEVILILVIICMLAAVAGTLVLPPLIHTQIEKTRALDMIRAAPVPAVPGYTCGSLIDNASQENQASATWKVDASDQRGTYLISVNIHRGADSALFHWAVDTQTGTITARESPSICQLP